MRSLIVATLLALPATVLAAHSVQAAPAGDAAGASGTAPRCAGKMATIVGTKNHDHLVGTARADVIVGGRGNDVIDGAGGDDVICGEGGRDKVDGGDGTDLIFGGLRQDQVDGGPERDRVYGGPDDDVFADVDGSDVVSGGSGNDRFNVTGRLSPGHAVLKGGPGNDGFRVFTQEVSLRGGTGRDLLFTSAPYSTDGSGSLTIDYRVGLIRNNVDVWASSVVGFEATKVFFSQVTYYGTPGDDLLSMQEEAGPLVAYGLAGDDSIRGSWGDDLIDGGEGRDTADGREGDDTCVAEVRIGCEADASGMKAA